VPPSRVLGVDPSLTATGYAVLVQAGQNFRALTHGAIRTASKTPRPARLLAIQDGLLAVIREWEPEEVAVESPFVAENVRSAMAVGEARAAALLAAAASGLPAHEYPPAEVKRAVSGYGRSEKSQVMEMVLRQIEVDEAFASSDAADAAAVALCHFFSSRAARLTAGRAGP
jgi:crossover junction endodeoxyribonuclease RuvC